MNEQLPVKMAQWEMVCISPSCVLISTAFTRIEFLHMAFCLLTMISALSTPQTHRTEIHTHRLLHTHSYTQACSYSRTQSDIQTQSQALSVTTSLFLVHTVHIYDYTTTEDLSEKTVLHFSAPSAWGWGSYSQKGDSLPSIKHCRAHF